MQKVKSDRDANSHRRLRYFYRGIKKHASFPLVLVGAPRKGQTPGRVTPWIAPGLPHAQVGLRCAFRQASPKPLPTVFTIKLLAETSHALLLSVHGGGHTTNAVGVVSQDYKPLRCTTNDARKHQEIRGILTSLNTRPNT